MNNYEEKLEAKRERLQELAEKARQDSARLYDSAQRMASVIPFGQPILVGHHSEGRDRRYRARIHNTYGKAFEVQDKAKYYERRAESVGSNGISSEDPEAVIKLSKKLESIEQAQEKMKAANKIVRRKPKNEWTADKQHALLKLGFGETQIRDLFTPDFAGRIGFAGFETSNNSANIRRIKERIEYLTRIQSEPETIKEADGIRVEDSPSENRVRIFFPGKPAEEIRTRLKANGFRWAPSIGAWQAYRNYHSRQVAQGFVAERQEV